MGQIPKLDHFDLYFNLWLTLYKNLIQCIFAMLYVLSLLNLINSYVVSPSKSRSL